MPGSVIIGRPLWTDVFKICSLCMIIGYFDGIHRLSLFHHIF